MQQDGLPRRARQLGREGQLRVWGLLGIPVVPFFPFLFGGSEYYTLILKGLLGNLV